MTQIEVRLNPDVPPTGSDLGFVNAARRSFNGRSEWEYRLDHPDDGEKWYCKKDFSPSTFSSNLPKRLKDKDKRLLEFLARGMTAKDFDDFCNKCIPHCSPNEMKYALWEWRKTPEHDTPFNHGFVSFEVKLPLFVARQLVKHEYLIVSEISRRYITDGIEFYEPDYWRKAAPDKKQGSLEEPVEGIILDSHRFDLAEYHSLIKKGVAPEQARMVLPQSMMVEWTWSGTPGAFFKMCQLRLAPDAQYESRIVAQKVYDFLCEYYPVSAPLMVKGVY